MSDAIDRVSHETLQNYLTFSPNNQQLLQLDKMSRYRKSDVDDDNLNFGHVTDIYS